MRTVKGHSNFPCKIGATVQRRNHFLDIDFRLSLNLDEFTTGVQGQAPIQFGIVTAMTVNPVRPTPSSPGNRSPPGAPGDRGAQGGPGNGGPQGEPGNSDPQGGLCTIGHTGGDGPGASVQAPAAPHAGPSCAGGRAGAHSNGVDENAAGPSFCPVHPHSTCQCMVSPHCLDDDFDKSTECFSVGVPPASLGIPESDTDDLEMAVDDYRVPNSPFESSSEGSTNSSPKLASNVSSEAGMEGSSDMETEMDVDNRVTSPPFHISCKGSAERYGHPGAECSTKAPAESSAVSSAACLAESVLSGAIAAGPSCITTWADMTLCDRITAMQADGRQERARRRNQLRGDIK